MAWIFVSKKLCWYLQIFQLYQPIITHTINTFWNVFLSDAQDKMHPLRASVLLSLQNLPYSHYCQFHRVERQASRGTVVKEGSLGGVPLISDKLWPSRYTNIHSCLPLPTPICNIFSKTLKNFFTQFPSVTFPGNQKNVTGKNIRDVDLLTKGWTIASECKVFVTGEE